MVLGDPANTVLQPSICDVMKACTRVFADSASSDHRILRIVRRIAVTCCSAHCYHNAALSLHFTDLLVLVQCTAVQRSTAYV